ncbi:uncharacterized protein LOC117303256 isoform X2 [Asterias rubens]|uniref:uncharacterized protein LOC117303256 isoform X2 n=1 Tax=Asterias rubens TaxID=7604 RepID=UPI001455C7AA|nr:uncharacterized protein LOC117303256 isoform X2 [Asterias rubens]
MASCKRIYSLFLVGCSLFSIGIIGQAVGAVVECIQNEKTHCSCTMSDGSGRYDLTALSGKPNEPFFPNIAGRTDHSETYSYDPCVPYTLKPVSGSEQGSCEGVAGCRKTTDGSTSTTTYFGIAKHFSVVFHYDSVTQQLILKYTNEDIFHPFTTEVDLKCSPSAANSVTLEHAEDDAVLFRLHSPHACLVGDGLSFGSILCIIFSLLVVLYFAGGALFLVFVQNKPVNEAIPNKGFWMELPSLITDGAKFASNGFKSEPATHHRLENVDVDIDDEDEDIVLKGGGSAGVGIVY